MSSITIHDIDENLSEKLTAEARRRRMSKNALIKLLLAEKVGIPVDGAYTDDYREFVGLWTAEEHAAFNESQIENVSIDPGDWNR